jgi:hypothetical protein
MSYKVFPKIKPYKFDVSTSTRIMLLNVASVFIYTTTILGLSTANDNKNIVISLIILNLLVSLFFMYNVYRNYTNINQFIIYLALLCCSLVNVSLYAHYYQQLNNPNIPPYKNNTLKIILYISNILLSLLFADKAFVIAKNLKKYIDGTI